MEIGINDLDYSEEDNELLLQQQQEPPVDEGGAEPPVDGDGNEPPAGGQEENEEDAITTFLKTKGIADPTKIKFENEDGDIEEVAWGDLSKDEQLNILNTSNSDPDRALDESEINLINEIRSGGMSVDEYKQMLLKQGADNAQEPVPQYEIDSIPDDELYVADLQQKLGDEITDEELAKALEAEKQNPELFAKLMKGLRQEYKQLEDLARNNQVAEQQRQYQEQLAQFQQSVLGEIQGLNQIGNLDVTLDTDDMNDVANFILSNDAAGVNYFAKALNDPAQLVKAAWFLTKGEQAINDISDYFTQLIKEVSKAQYKKGFEDGKSGKTSKSSAPRVVKPTQTQKESNNTRVFKTIDDLD